MKKVLFVLAAFDKGGIEKVTLDIINNLDPNKYDITVYTVWYGGYCQSQVKSYIKVRPFFFKRYVKGIVRLIDYLPPRLLYKLFIRGKFDVEIAAGDGECSKIVAGSINKKSKKISWIHMDVIERGSNLRELREKGTARKIYDKFDEIVCVSEACCGKFIRKFGNYKNISIVRNPLPQNEIVKMSEEPMDDIELKHNGLNLISAGRLVEQKGYDRLIRCCNKLANHDGIDFQLYIIGEGTKRYELESLISSYKLDDRIHLLGFKANPYKYIKNMDMFVLSSRDESFSLVIGEAIILKQVVVSTDCSGIKEWLGDSEFGLVCENNEESLYLAIKKLCEDASLYSKYKRNVEIRAKQIDFNKSLKEFERIL